MNPLEHISISQIERETAPATVHGERETFNWRAIFHGWFKLINLGKVAVRALSNPSQRISREGRDVDYDAMVAHFAASVFDWWAEFQHMESESLSLV